jgi:hypothetical protein
MEREVSQQPDCGEIASGGAPYVMMSEEVDLSAIFMCIVSKHFCGVA